MSDTETKGANDEVYASKPWLKNYDDHVPEFLDYDNKPYAVKFQEAVERVGDNIALIYMDTILTFKDVDRLSNQLAAYFIKIGLKPDDVIGLHALNIPANYVGMVAAQKAGCVTTGLSPLLTPHEMEHQLNDAGAKAVLTMDLLFPLIAGVADKCDFSTVIVAGTTDFMPGEFPPVQVQEVPGKTVISFDDAVADMPEDPVLVPRSMDDTIFIMYTGGTTGPAKGAVLTQRNFMANCQQTLTWADEPGFNGEVGISAFPMFHMAGLAMAAGLLQGGMGQICVPNPRDLDFIIGAIEKHHPTSIINVPTIFFELLKKPEFRALDFTNIGYAISGAAPFPPESIPDMESVIGENKFVELYGMTETSPVSVCNPRYGKKKIGSVGLPYPDTEFKLTDPETGETVPLGETGEICVRGPGGDEGLLQPARGDGQRRPGRLDAHRGPRAHGRGRLRLRGGPLKGHGHRLGLQGLHPRAGRRADAAPGRRDGRLLRIPGPQPAGLGAGHGGGDPQAGHREERRGEGEDPRLPEGDRGPLQGAQGHQLLRHPAHQRGGQDPQARAQGHDAAGRGVESFSFSRLRRGFE